MLCAMSSRPDLLQLAPLMDYLVAQLRENFTCHEYFRADDKNALLREQGASIRAVVGVGGTVYDSKLLDRFPALEIIGVHGVGYDGVPVDYCRQRGIRVTNTPDVLTEDVADIALALVLMTSRRLVEANRYLHAGAWSKSNFALATKPAGKRAGILGLGRIGKAIARRLEAIGMEIGYHGRHPQEDCALHYFPSLIELARWCDFLIVACPGGKATRNLVHAEVLAALGPDGTLINIARGSIIDEPALIHALQNRIIKSAGLDVFANEPAVPAELQSLDHAVLLPHVGSATVETRRAMADLVVENLLAHFSGKQLPSLIPELGQNSRN
jgi:lactate dehydrogenase-like 2-hydroxyacid dehydrogenase